MLERCPVCRARWRNAMKVCRRCGVDLSHAIHVLEQGQNWERCAVMHLSQGRQKKAKQCIQHAHYLCASLFSRELNAFL